MENTTIYELTSKAQVAEFVSKKVNECKNGLLNALELRVQATMISKALDQINDQTKDLQLSEAQLHSAKSFDFGGAKIEVSELGTKYNYTVCNDPIISEMMKQMEALKAEIKDRETFLKGIKGSLTIVDETTGEVSTLYPPNKTSSTGIKVTLK